MPNSRILLVDDEPDILEFVSYNLKKEGYNVLTALNGLEALERVQKHEPHLVLLDVMMPGMDGIETCENIRKLEKIVQPVIAFLTARGEDYSQIAGFDAGADDYIQKPVRIKVLLTRIKALLKRFDVASDISEVKPIAGCIEAGGLIIDRERYLVLKGDEQISLPRKEFELLALLLSKPQRVFSREDIFSAIWHDSVIVGDRTIDVHIRKLREKIGEDHIRTIKGVGYKFVE
jgi:two-component system, OmpR family, alkaline phosphatase synthesis response regulator PhoP